MQTLKLADDLFPGLLAQTKGCTIRAGRRDIELGPLTFESVSGQLAAVTIAVDRVSYVYAKALSQREAEMDGAESPGELVRALQQFYPTLTLESIVTVVEFH